MALLILFGLTILLLAILDYIWKPKFVVPCPHRIPIFGNFFSLGTQSHIRLTEWAKSFGNIFTLQVCRSTYLVLNGYDAIYEALKIKGNDTAGRGVRLLRINLFMDNAEDLIFKDASPSWRKVRKFVGSYLKRYSEGNASEHIETVTLTISNNLNESISKKIEENHLLDPYEDIYLAIVNNISSIISGSKYNSNDVTFQNWITMERLSMKYGGMSEGRTLDIFPLARYFGSGKRAYKAIMLVRDLKHSLYKGLKQEFDDNMSQGGFVRDGLAFAMMKEQMDEKSDLREILTDDMIRNIMFDLMIAGVATSTSSLYTFMIIMAAYPSVQDKLAKEIKSQLPSIVDEKTQITLSCRDNMPYTMACLMELQRYGSFVPLSLLHNTQCNTNIQGVHVPKDTIVVTNLFGLHHNEEYWDDPWKFNPNHFLDEFGEIVPVDHPNRKRLLAFGAGPRICLGQHLALARLFILITNFIRMFRIDPIEGTDELSDVREYDAGLTLTPKRQKLRFSIRP